MNSYYIFFLFLFSFFFILFGCTSSDESEKSTQTSAHGEMSDITNLNFTIPEGWVKEQPTGSMRKAQFRLPGKNEMGDAELAVFVFPGGGGGVQANIDRWIGQFKQPDGGISNDKTEIKKVESHGMVITLVYISGTYLAGSMGGPAKELSGYAMMAAIVETSSDPWFFKAVGPQATINGWRAEFESFVKTIKKTQ
jgi:hypothetical protein